MVEKVVCFGLSQPLNTFEAEMERGGRSGNEGKGWGMRGKVGGTKGSEGKVEGMRWEVRGMKGKVGAEGGR